MRVYVIEKITDEAAEKYNNWDDVLANEEENTEIVGEFESFEEAAQAYEDGVDNGIYTEEMYCIGIRN